MGGSQVCLPVLIRPRPGFVVGQSSQYQLAPAKSHARNVPNSYKVSVKHTPDPRGLLISPTTKRSWLRHRVVSYGLMSPFIPHWRPESIFPSSRKLPLVPPAGSDLFFLCVPPHPLVCASDMVLPCLPWTLPNDPTRRHTSLQSSPQGSAHRRCSRNAEGVNEWALSLLVSSSKQDSGRPRFESKLCQFPRVSTTQTSYLMSLEPRSRVSLWLLNAIVQICTTPGV